MQFQDRIKASSEEGDRPFVESINRLHNLPLVIEQGRIRQFVVNEFERTEAIINMFKTCS